MEEADALLHREIFWEAGAAIGDGQSQLNIGSTMNNKMEKMNNLEKLLLLVRRM